MRPKRSGSSTLEQRENVTQADLIRYADLGLDVERFHNDLKQHAHLTRVAQDVESADLSGATGTRTFFVSGQLHYGAYDLDSLSAAVAAAGAQRAGPPVS